MALAGSGMPGIFSSRAVAVQPASAASGHCMARPAATLHRMSGQTLIERCTAVEQPGWLDLRLALWPDATADDHRSYMAMELARPDRFLQLMIYDELRQPIGFIEGS